MNCPELEPQEFTPVEVNWSDRWRISSRLQELEITSDCPLNQSLRVQLNSPLALLQLWAVLKRFTLSRQEQVHWLESCWQFPGDPQSPFPRNLP